VVLLGLTSIIVVVVVWFRDKRALVPAVGGIHVGGVVVIVVIRVALVVGEEDHGEEDGSRDPVQFPGGHDHDSAWIPTSRWDDGVEDE